MPASPWSAACRAMPRPAGPARRRPGRLGGGASCWTAARSRHRSTPSMRWRRTRQVAGPAIIESATTTVLLRPGDAARMDARGWLDVAVG